MKKKHELLKYAYENYPKGTKFKSKTIDSVFDSTGSFYFDDTEKIRCSGNDHIIYSQHGWATIVPASILSGKCAIAVNNEREFKLLMEHYAEKGWRWCSGHTPSSKEPLGDMTLPNAVMYSDECYHTIIDGTRVVDFADFAAEVGIKPPVFVLTSEDGVPIYEGDEHWVAELNPIFKKWSVKLLQTERGSLNLHVANPYSIRDTVDHKSFSTKEAAEKFCKEQNKPKEIVFEHNTVTITVTENGFNTVAKSDDRSFVYSKLDLEEIYAAYKSLQ